MKLFGKRLVCLLLSVFLLAALTLTADAKLSDYPSARVYADGLLIGRAYRYGQELYLSVGDVCAYLGMDAAEAYNKKTKEAIIAAKGLELQAVVGESYVVVNGRYLLNLRGVLAAEGRVFFPVALIEKIFGLRAEIEADLSAVELSLRDAQILQGGENYYEETFGSDNLLWLSRLISAEAAGQPFTGMIGVGNVVLNRVASDRFPDTIMEVIFDTKNGVQFSPVYDGSIYEEASAQSVIAACIALEGYKTVGDSLYFIAPALADDGWLWEYYNYVTTIGQHEFFM